MISDPIFELVPYPEGFNPFGGRANDVAMGIGAEK